MACKIKLQRKGAKKKPVYRVVVQDSASATKARVIEEVGQYNPMADPVVFNVDKDKIQAWLKKGARPTGRLRILLGKAGVMGPVDLAALPKRKSKKAQAEAPEEAVNAPAKAEEKSAQEAKAEEVQ